MRNIFTSVLLVGAVTCVPEHQACDNDIVMDEITGQITLNEGGRCKALPFGLRADAVEMATIVLGDDADPCRPVDVYHVEVLEDDLDFGPSDPPNQGEILLDETAGLEIGTRVQVTLWSGAAFSDARRSIDTWSRTFDWGVEDTSDTPVCFVAVQTAGRSQPRHRQGIDEAVRVFVGERVAAAARE